ncbi:luc7-like protein 3 [Papaver somniferum]|uniref:luc7-like protein 3 n=1 Tax=Papaver somniferum TaxID=3469 RepID=UPI000E6F7B9A|nr:luc7-like protein 3 [Papaver somniferum]
MVRIESVVEQGMKTRRSHRLAERRRTTNLEQQEERLKEHQRTEIPIGSQREQGLNNEIDYDRVSIHTAKNNSTDEGQRIGNEEPITVSEGNMTIEELRQKLIIERKREEEERANLIRQNDDLREENLRLQEQRSRIATRSKSRSSRSSSRHSQSNRRSDRRRKHMEVVEENSQEDENLEDQRERRRVIDMNTHANFFVVKILIVKGKKRIQSKDKCYYMVEKC